MITGAVKYNADCTYSVYWQDNNNPDRTLNLDNVPYICTEELVDACLVKTCTTALDCDALRLHPLVKQPCITVNTSIGAGQLQNGSYQAVIAYSHESIKLTDYCTPSQPQALWDHTGVGGSIDIKITNLDLNFSEYELVVISVINQQTIAKKIGYYSTMQSMVHLDIYLESLETIPLFTIPLKSQVYEKSKKMFSLNGYLIRTSVTTQPYFNYQPSANKIKAEWVVAQYPADYYWKKGNTVGYMRDEVYSFFIRWVYKTGARSASFHIPGRASIANDLIVLPSSNLDITDPNQNKVWQVYDTSTSTAIPPGPPIKDGGIPLFKGNMGYWESTELYPADKPQIWGNLCGKPIRHHKMPSNETTHIHDTTGNFINILGVQFNNIAHPTDTAGNIITSISGYEILRGSREGNRTIVAKGMFNNMLTFPIPGSNLTGLMQNYPYNDIRIEPTSGGDYFLENVSHSQGYYSFHSPETTIVRPYLGSGVYTKIYTEEIGTMKGVYDIPYKHPKQKVITNAAFGTAAAVALGIALVSAVGKTSTTTGGSGHTTILGGEVTTTTVSPPWVQGTGTLSGTINSVYRNPKTNFDTISTTTTEGGGGTALSGLVTMIAQSGASATTADPFSTVTALENILDIIEIASKFTTYLYEGMSTVLDIIYRAVQYRDYVIQFNSHAFYNNFIKVVNNNKPVSVTNPSITRKLISSKYTSSGVQDFNATHRINNTYRNKFVTLSTANTLPVTVTTDDTKRSWQDYGIGNEGVATTAAYYGALKLDYQNQYGQLTGIMQIPTDSCVNKTIQLKDFPNSTGIIFGGDVYINRYTEKNMYAFFNTWMYDMPNGTNFNYELYYNGAKPRYHAEFRHYAAEDFNVHFTWNISDPVDFGTPSDLHTFDGDTANGVFFS